MSAFVIRVSSRANPNAGAKVSTVQISKLLEFHMEND